MPPLAALPLLVPVEANAFRFVCQQAFDCPFPGWREERDQSNPEHARFRSLPVSCSVLTELLLGGYRP